MLSSLGEMTQNQFTISEMEEEVKQAVRDCAIESNFDQIYQMFAQ